jgi:ankyrin repeat protein
VPDRHVPVRPDLRQLKHQAKDLLRAIRRGEPAALDDLARNHPKTPDPSSVRLADAQLTLARSYGVASWPRLALACRLIDAIWNDDRHTIRDLILKHPQLLHEDARGVRGNWGPPMSYAANLGRDAVVSMLRELGATDVSYAFERAALQGRLDTARLLHGMGARPTAGSVMGPAEALSGPGLQFLLELGAPLTDEHGDPLAPVGLVLETYSRNPEGKHQCLELMAAHGITLPDTPTMALHRGRIDLLESHLARDPQLFSRTFTHREIYPLDLGCHEDESLALGGTPLAGTTLLHIAIDDDAMDLVRWLIAHGADVDARGAADADGFGGHTALFGCVVSQPYRCGRQRDASAGRLLLEHGADPSVRASLRKRLRFVDDETTHEYHDVTPLAWGERFHDQDWVNPHVLELLRERLRVT